MSTVEDGALTVVLYWANRPEDSDRLAYSIQLFDSAGTKVQQMDTVMSKRPLARHQLDLSRLNPGEYEVKLIVYRFHTGVSMSGTVVHSGDFFERELEIARFTIE